MPRTGHIWRHVIINTKNSWLHGDPRGFRSSNPDITSTGDYKNPPPPGEHGGLYDYNASNSGDAIRLSKECRRIIGQVIVQCLLNMGYRCLCAAVDEIHAHILAELPVNRDEVKVVIGDVKRRASRAVKSILPGSVWSAGGEFKPIRDQSHQSNVFGYILYDQGDDAWTWSFQDAAFEGMFARPVPEERKRRRRNR